jgi:hypothetical protein
MRADLPQPMPAESFDRPARMSNSLMPAASELQQEIGTLPVIPAAHIEFQPVQRKRQKQNSEERRASTDEFECESESCEEAQEENGPSLDLRDGSNSDCESDDPDAATRLSVRS